MARIRTIKPEFFTSEDIVQLSPLARLLYVALWCESDKEGRMVWKPRTFKIRYLPADDADVDALCAELVSVGVVVLYGEGYAYIPAFKSHQHINPRESASVLPAPEEKRSRVGTRQARVNDASARDSDAQGGREGKGKEGKGTPMVGGFDQFWDAWPKSERKQDKAKCAEKWAKHGFDDVLLVILADIAVKKKTQKWQGGFIEAPEVYLNNKRWEDGVEPDSPSVTVPGSSERDPALIKVEEDLKRAVPMPKEIRERISQLKGSVFQ